MASQSDTQATPSPYTTIVSYSSSWYAEDIYNATVSGYTSTLATYATDPNGIIPTASASTALTSPPSITSSPSQTVLAPTTSLGTTDVPTTSYASSPSSINIPSSPSSTASSSAITTSRNFPISTNAFNTSSALTSSSPASATSTGAPISTNAQNSTGLYASIGVLAGLLVLALIALAILLFRRRKQSRENDYAAADETKAGEDSSMMIADMESIISGLQKQLQQKESQLQNSQVALLQHRRQGGGSNLDDKQVYQRFARLSQSINDWVLTHFKNIRHGAILRAEVEDLAAQVSPEYGMLLQDPRGKYLVLRGIVAVILFRSFTTGELLGQPAYSELKQLVGAKSAVSESSEWRSLTIRLLEKSPSFRRDQASSVQEISEKIDQITSSLTGLDKSEARLQHLNQIIEAAATLALELETEQTQYKVERPNSRTFEARSMEDVLQDHKGEVLQGKPIRGLVFPGIIKIQGQNGADQGLVIFKAQVIV
ncbi:Mucin-12 [Xylographa soralifera]|nr:Mucin-12 [Xylographa soralifera]